MQTIRKKVWKSIPFCKLTSHHEAKKKKRKQKKRKRTHTKNNKTPHQPHHVVWLGPAYIYIYIYIYYPFVPRHSEGKSGRKKKGKKIEKEKEKENSPSRTKIFITFGPSAFSAVIRSSGSPATELATDV